MARVFTADAYIDCAYLRVADDCQMRQAFSTRRHVEISRRQVYFDYYLTTAFGEWA